MLCCTRVGSSTNVQRAIFCKAASQSSVKWELLVLGLLKRTEKCAQYFYAWLHWVKRVTLDLVMLTLPDSRQKLQLVALLPSVWRRFQSNWCLQRKMISLLLGPTPKFDKKKKIVTGNRQPSPSFHWVSHVWFRPNFMWQSWTINSVECTDAKVWNHFSASLSGLTFLPRLHLMKHSLNSH